MDVRAAISSKFGGYKIIETQTVERFDQKLLRYEVHLEGVKEVLKTLFEENGALVSQSSKPKKLRLVSYQHVRPPSSSLKKQQRGKIKVFLCFCCDLPFAKLQFGRLVIQSKHHSDIHSNSLGGDELESILELLRQADDILPRVAPR